MSFIILINKFVLPSAYHVHKSLLNCVPLYTAMQSKMTQLFIMLLDIHLWQDLPTRAVLELSRYRNSIDIFQTFFFYSNFSCFYFLHAIYRSAKRSRKNSGATAINTFDRNSSKFDR